MSDRRDFQGVEFPQSYADEIPRNRQPDFLPRIKLFIFTMVSQPIDLG